MVYHVPCCSRFDMLGYVGMRVSSSLLRFAEVECGEIASQDQRLEALGLKYLRPFPYMGAQVLALFGVTSLLMWALPLGVLYAFNNKLFPGSEGLSQQSTSLWSGLLAVLSVNVVIVFYIILALREKPVAPTPHPDPAFLSRARASLARGQAQDQGTAGSSEKSD